MGDVGLNWGGWGVCEDGRGEGGRRRIGRMWIGRKGVRGWSGRYMIVLYQQKRRLKNVCPSLNVLVVGNIDNEGWSCVEGCGMGRRVSPSEVFGVFVDTN